MPHHRCKTSSAAQTIVHFCTMPPVRAEWTFFSYTSRKSHACRPQQQQAVVLGFAGTGIPRDHKGNTWYEARTNRSKIVEKETAAVEKATAAGAAETRPGPQR